MNAAAFPSWQKRIFALCWLGYCIAYTGRFNITIALTSLHDYFAVDYSQITLLSTAYLCVYAIGQLINGYIGDKVNPRYFVFAGLLSSALLNFVLGFVNSFALFLVVWSLNGLVQSMQWGPMIRLLGIWFDGEQRDNVIFGLFTSAVAGTLLSWGGLGGVLGFFGWRYVFIVPGVCIAVIAVLWLIFVRKSPRDVGFDIDFHGGGQPLRGGEKKSLLQFILSAGLPLAVVCCIAQGTMREGINQLGPTLVQETSSVSLKQLPLYIAFIPIMNLLGILLARKLFRKLDSDGGLSCAFMFGAGTLGALLLILFSKNIILAALSMGICSMMMTGANSILLGIVPVSFSKQGKASAVAGLLDFTSYFAAGLFVAVAGFVRDATGGWSLLFLIWTAFAAVGIFSSFLYRRYSRK